MSQFQEALLEAAKFRDAETAESAADAEALRHAARFLAQKGLILDDVLSSIDVRDGEVLAVVGSVADGLANQFSDLDFLLIGERRQSGSMIFRQDGQENIVFQLADDLEVNVEYVDASELAALAEEVMGLVVADADAPPTMSQLSEAQVTRLHRIRVGGAVFGDLQSWRARLLTDLLPDYVLVENIIMHYVHREDALGEFVSGESESANYNLANAMGFLAAAVLAQLGETNTKRQWRMKLLRRARDLIGGDRINMLQRFMTPSFDEDAASLQSQATAFADQLIQECLDSRPHLAPLVQDLLNRVTFVKHAEPT